MLHNAAMKVRELFSKVDKIIAKVKPATVKNPTRKSIFQSAELQLPPEPVVTRWASWLNAAIYYSKNVHQVRSIFEEINDGGLLVERAKKALNATNVDENLFDIVSNC